MGDRHATLLATLDQIVHRVAADQGVEAVEISLRGNSQRRILRVDIDRAGPEGVGIQDCQRVSEALGDALDQDDPLAASYVLEVSSPGIDRPIQSDDDIRRNTGRLVRVTLDEAVEGAVEHSGRLVGREEDALILETSDGASIRLPWSRVTEARQDIDL